MKISYNWLQTFFAEPLPSAEKVAEALTFHSSEVEDVVAVEGDTVISVKVLPDKAAWLSSHRGVAKELSAILGRPLARDPLLLPSLPVVSPERIAITLDDKRCDHYGAALVVGVKVGESPKWLKQRLAAIGQRPINNVVDAANYVMFEMGQPLHAFDAGKLGAAASERRAVGVRQADADERLTTLTGEEVALTAGDMVIVDATNNHPLALAGVKGGMLAAVDETTAALLVESAHFDRVSVRKTAQRHNLRTDASARFENGVPRALAPIGLARVCEILSEITGGRVVAVNMAGEGGEKRSSVSVSLKKINDILGLDLSAKEVTDIFSRLDYRCAIKDDAFTVTPPFERDDLVIAEDVIEEVGRFYGLARVSAAPPRGVVSAVVNARHYYAERVRRALVALGFAEIMTSSFRARDKVKLKNALAVDKSYLRSVLRENVGEALAKNVPHRDLLGLPAIKLFELGVVFEPEAEHYHLGLAVRAGSEYKAKADDKSLAEAKAAVAAALGLGEVSWLSSESGIAECRLSDIIPALPLPSAYEKNPPPSSNYYRPFSPFPAVSRDIALWVREEAGAEEVAAALRAAVGAFCVRLTHIDTFKSDGRTSYAFRLVFQAPDRTFTGKEIDGFMEILYALSREKGWVVR
jgi:phenylalanyl-tRNA synthetase beta chain